MGTQRVPIATASVDLGAFLKWAQVVQTGGEAKALIQSGRVRVNGAVERRRGRTLLPGDRVEVGARTLEVVRGTHAARTPTAPELPQPPPYRGRPRSRA